MSSQNGSSLDSAIKKTAWEIGDEIESGQLDPRDLADHILAKADAASDVFVRITPERARREAAAAHNRAESGLRRHRLDGVPISWKDLFDIAGQPTEAGSRLCAGKMAMHDAAVVARATNTGLVCIGKTHLSELAFSGLGYNPVTATSPNRFDDKRAPGGSSSGAAASVSFNLAMAAIGSDTGGSVRIPAAWNDLVGLKTTPGVIPLDGISSLSPSLDTVGPLTRCVEDAALLFEILARTDPIDLSNASLIGRRFLVPETVVFDDMPEEARAAFEAILAHLSSDGATIVHAAIPEFAVALQTASTHGAIVNTEGYAIWREAIEARPDDIHPMIRERFRSGASYRADQIDFARLEMKRLAKSYLARTAGYDVVIMPTTANVAPLISTIAEDDDAYIRENLLALRNTRLANLLGLCALAIPAGLTASRAPVSLMAFSAPFSEARLLCVGAGIERSLAKRR